MNTWTIETHGGETYVVSPNGWNDGFQVDYAETLGLVERINELSQEKDAEIERLKGEYDLAKSASALTSQTIHELLIEIERLKTACKAKHDALDGVLSAWAHYAKTTGEHGMENKAYEALKIPL